jgi:general secretion pathway protein C
VSASTGQGGNARVRGRSLADVAESARRIVASPRAQARAAFACTGLLVIAIAWLLADTLWFMATGSAGEQATGPARRTPTAAAAPPVDMQRIANQHLFGVAEAAPPPTPDGPAPVTSLPLQLLGVFVAGSPAESNAVLAEVHNDRVVLQRGAERESLAFPESGGGIASVDEPVEGLGGSNFQDSDPGLIEVEPSDAEAVEAPAAEPVQASSGSSEGGSLARYRDRLKSEPTSVLSEIGMQPISGGAAQGYRVGDNVGEGLARVGLQPGDVVLTVNGRPVGNVQNDQQQVDSVMSQGSARLEIQRGNRRFFVTASLR